jgi:hypothetical protein
MPEARIKTNFGEIVIPYSNLDELTKALEDVPKAVAIVQEKTVGVVAGEGRKPKPGCEGVYEFDSNGRLRLNKKPTVKVSVAALALYANDPDPMALSELELVTGIPEIVRSVLAQTTNKKYFTQHGDRYGLSPVGFEFVTKKVLPSLK